MVFSFLDCGALGSDNGKRAVGVKRSGNSMTERGRPTDYRPEFCQKALELCQSGATDQELAEYFETSARSLYRWKLEHPEFCQALKAGKEFADERVERSLYAKAIGYTFDAVKIFMPAGADGPVYAPYREHVPPDTSAAMFWLKNRRAGNWRDKLDHELSGKDGGPVQFERIERVIVDPKQNPTDTNGSGVPPTT
jgi:hypothetical protein